MNLDHRILLAQNIANPVAAIQQGVQTAGMATDLSRQNALDTLYREQGPQIAAGQQNALDAVARVNPFASLDVQTTRLGMDATRATMQQAREAGARAAQEHAMNMSQAERQSEHASTLRLYQQAQLALQSRNMQAYKAITRQLTDGQEVSPDDFPMLAASIEGGLEALTAAMELAPQQPAPGNDYERYVARERQARREPVDEFTYAAGKRGPGMIIESTPGGGFRMVQGDVDDVGRMQPSSPQAMVSTIDGILNDPALERSTGVFSFLQNIPGTPQKRFAGRARQLEGQAFLQAFESLKGGGQITEIEGLKATQAIGRLDTAQNARDYREALTELREVLVAAQTRPRGWVNTPEGQAAARQGAQAQPAQTQGQPGAAAGPQFESFEQYAADPGVQAAAKANNVTPQEMWDLLQSFLGAQQ